MPEKHKLPKGALRLVAEGCHAHIEMAKGDGEEETPQMKMTVYSGKPIEDHWWWGKFVIDLDGIKFDRNKYPILENHRTDLKIAFSGRPIINGSVELDPKTTVLVETEAADEFVKLSKKGFPYQASIYAIPSVIEKIERDASAMVNGYKLKGPATIWRQCLYQEASICVFGWDKKTEAAAFSKEEVEVDMQLINDKGGDIDSLEEGKMPKLKLRKGGEIMPETLEALKLKYPDLTKQLSDEVSTALQITFDKKEEAMQAQITQLSSEKEEMGARVLSLEKKDTLRSETELTLSASRIWDDKLKSSDVADHLFDKVKKHVSHTKFVKDNILDVAAFTEAIDAEIADWEKRGATATVLGAGFNETNREDANTALSAQEKTDQAAADELLQMAGQEQKSE